MTTQTLVPLDLPLPADDDRSARAASLRSRHHVQRGDRDAWLALFTEDAIAADPQAMAGAPTLPYLLKILAIEQPLSLQVHPSAEQAREGFAEEEARGINRTAFGRTFRDDRHKPEMVVALTPMRLLVGFRPPEDLARDLVAIGADELVPLVEGATSYFSYVKEVLDGGSHPRALAALARTPQDETSLGAAAHNARTFPGDPGALVALAMNSVTLGEGESRYVPPGTIHAYQSGVGLEIMANSDNVVRGGLTAKAVDLRHLEAIMDGTPQAPQQPEVSRSGGATTYRAPVPEFTLTVIDGGEAVAASGPRIVLALAPTRVDHAAGSERLAPGAAIFVAAADGPVTVASRGVAVIAAQGDAAPNSLPDAGAGAAPRLT